LKTLSEYLDNCKGILVSKQATTEDYDVTVQRELSDDKQAITMTSTASFEMGDPL
jgi:flagellar biosynthesis component FlhA